MELLIFLVLLTTLALTAMRFGADSRDGKPDWSSNRRTQPTRRAAGDSRTSRSLMKRLVHPRGYRPSV
jgi:hypothetical protein